MSAEPGPKAVKAPPASRTKIGRAVLKNSAEIDLIGVSVIALIDSKIDSLRQEQERLNSDESRAAIDRAILDGRTSNVRSKRSLRRHRNLPPNKSAKALSPRKRILWLREFVIGGPNDTFKFAIRCSTKYSKQTTSDYWGSFSACAGWQAWNPICRLLFPAPGSAERVSPT